jgi:peptidoglycan biosynthesis protein MviN/MurJ (putative lipid II flippase)
VLSALIGRLRGVHDNHKRIASGALLIGLLVLGAKLFVAAREVAIAWRYGISGTVDAYQLSLTITTWLPMMLAGVATAVLVPRLVALRHRDADYRGLIAELNGGVLFLGLGVASLTWFAADAAAALLGGPLDAAIVRLTADMTRNMAPLALLVLAGGYLAARLQARERFAYTAAEAIPAIALTLFVVVAPAGFNAWPLVWGTVLGYCLQLVVLAGMVQSTDPPLGALRFRHRSEEWPTLYGALLLMGLGQLFITASIPIDQAFAARLGEGAVATLGYVNRIVTLISGLGTVVLARALLPVLSRAVADGAHALGRRQALQWALIMFILAMAGAAVGWLLAPFVVTIFFERGAFDAEATAVVTHVLRYGLIQLPPFFAGIVLVQWYAAANRYGVILGVTTAALALKVVLNAALAPQLGVAGIMLSTAAMYLVTMGLMALAIYGGPRPADAD